MLATPVFNRGTAGDGANAFHGDHAARVERDLLGTLKVADRSRSATPGGSPMRPSTSMSFSQHHAEGALTPNTQKKQHLATLLGTESRPSSVYRVLKRRQPQAEFHMLWSAGPKRFDGYRQNLENELLTEKKAEQAQRRLLIKQVIFPQGRPLLAMRSRPHAQAFECNAILKFSQVRVQLRQKMQAACTNTKTLPRDLWDRFKVADDDGSGRLEVIHARRPIALTCAQTQQHAALNDKIAPPCLIADRPLAIILADLERTPCAAFGVTTHFDAALGFLFLV